MVSEDAGILGRRLPERILVVVFFLGSGAHRHCVAKSSHVRLESLEPRAFLRLRVAKSLRVRLEPLESRAFLRHFARWGKRRRHGRERGSERGRGSGSGLGDERRNRRERRRRAEADGRVVR